MDTEKLNPIADTKLFSSCDDVNSAEYKNVIIAILSVLVFLAILGVNLCDFFGRIYNFIFQSTWPVADNILSIFGYGIGTALNESSDAAASIAKTGVDVADGTVHNVGNLIINETRKENFENHYDKMINESSFKSDTAVEDESCDPIQNPMSCNKQKWCLINDYSGKNQCTNYN
jgi:hypothetical protein